MILFLDSVHPFLEESAKNAGIAVLHHYDLPEKLSKEQQSMVEAIVVRSRCPLTKNRIQLFKNLKVIARAGAGMENIDIDYCVSANIAVVNSPEGNRDAVGEQALGMLLMLTNHLKRADEEVRNGIWRRAENRGMEIKGKTVGIIGFGNMGSAFAQKLCGMEVSIIAYDKYRKNYAPAHVREGFLEEIFAQADIVSMHVPLTHETEYFCNEDFFKSFEKPIYFINTSRGMVCKTKALLQAIENNQVLGAALDVLEWEDYSFENFFDKKLPDDFVKLTSNANVILSPHIAGWTHESHLKHSQILFEKIKPYLQ